MKNSYKEMFCTLFWGSHFLIRTNSSSLTILNQNCLFMHAAAAAVGGARVARWNHILEKGTHQSVGFSTPFVLQKGVRCMMVSSKYTLGSFCKLESKRSCVYSCKLFIWNILSSSSNTYISIHHAVCNNLFGFQKYITAQLLAS